MIYITTKFLFTAWVDSTIDTYSHPFLINQFNRLKKTNCYPQIEPIEFIVDKSYLGGTQTFSNHSKSIRTYRKSSMYRLLCSCTVATSEKSI